MEVSRGDLVTVALPGDYGKPRPALVVQDNAYREVSSVMLLPLTSELRELSLLRVMIRPSRSNGLRQPSQIAIDKTATIPRAKIGQRIGRVDGSTMHSVETALARFLGLR
jgi:mRNA interferase MazF